jgi:hypothetical protein
MAKTEQVTIKKLSLDLQNFRTTPQKSEEDAINAMIIVKPDKFYALINSLLDDGYLPTDNIIVLKDGANLIVKEGNRRIAILKIIHGQYNVDDFNLPANIVTNIKLVKSTWKKENLKVPCAIYEQTEAKQVDKIVNLAHGKGEKANRDQWTSVARARHNRDSNKAPEPALDLLEKYLSKGQNLTNSQKELWAGDYPISVLDEALKRILTRLDVTNIGELVTKYPKNKCREELETIMRDIGLEQLNFPKIRDKNKDFADTYGISPIDQPTSTNSFQNNANTNAPINANTPPSTSASTGTSNSPSSSGLFTTNTTNSGNNSTTTSPSRSAYSTNDPKHVTSLLKKFIPKGNNRSKVVTLREEMKKLKIVDNPVAFCFLLRSIFEISAKAYCIDHNISTTKSAGQDKKLVEVLKSVTNHLSSNNTNQAILKLLHGALTEIAKSDGVLSVTSLNQLVHNPAFTISSTDVCILFGNIFFLLEAMN